MFILLHHTLKKMNESLIQTLFYTFKFWRVTRIYFCSSVIVTSKKDLKQDYYLQHFESKLLSIHNVIIMFI